MLRLGTIILTNFPFTDLSSTKRRPAIVISEVVPTETDVIVAFISSVIPSTISPTDFVLSRTHPDFSNTGLLRNSVFKMDKLATLDQRIFTGELGEVSAAILEELQNRLRIALCL
jgi:mRNA interferase MazF